jgi:hypothetical protein
LCFSWNHFGRVGHIFLIKARVPGAPPGRHPEIGRRLFRFNFGRVFVADINTIPGPSPSRILMHFSPLRADVIQIHSQLSPPPPPHYTFRPSTRKERRPTPKYRILRPSRPLHHLMHFETFISRSASAYYYHNSGRLSCKNAIDLATAFVKCTPRLRFLLHARNIIAPISKLK